MPNDDDKGELSKKRAAMLRIGARIPRRPTVVSYVLMLSAPAGGTEAVGTILTEAFRIQRFYTNATERGQMTIDGVYLGDDPENQFISPLNLDGYEFSAEHIRELQNEFLKEHGLLGKTDDQIQRYLDANGLSMPDVLRFDFPTLNRGQKLRITGKFGIASAISVVGLAPV